MTPQEETLTPKQRTVCSAIMIVIALSFSSVFVYAYVKGAQVRTQQARTQASLATPFAEVSTTEIRQKAVAIARGKRGQANCLQFREEGDAAPFWTISKIAMRSENSPRPASPVIAYYAAPGSWNVCPTGVVSVPPNAELGLYTLQCQAGEYLFEVVQGKKTAPKSKLAQTSSAKVRSQG